MTSYGYQDPENSVASDDRSGKLRIRHHQVIQKRIKWKSGAAEHDLSGKSETTSWDMMQQIDPRREEPLFGGNAHSARYGEMIHDGSVKPKTKDHQEEANSDNFVMGSDAAKLVNKVKD